MTEDDFELMRIRQRKIQELQKQLEIKEKYPLGQVHTLNETNFTEFIKVAPVAIIDMWADWCRPCHAMAPVMEQLAREWAERSVLIGKVNIDHNRNIAAQYGVQSIPTFLIFKKGRLVQRVVGAVGKAPFDKLLHALASDL